MGKFRIEDHGPEILKIITAELHRRLSRCAMLVLNRWKALLNVDGTGVGPTGKLIYGAHPSKPGEPPRKQRGRLLASAAWEIIKLIARVGTNLPYGRILEQGGAKVKARPSLGQALKELMAQIRSILSAPMRGPD
jgi:hypothetical protein